MKQGEELARLVQREVSWLQQRGWKRVFHPPLEDPKQVLAQFRFGFIKLRNPLLEEMLILGLVWDEEAGRLHWGTELMCLGCGQTLVTSPHAGEEGDQPRLGCPRPRELPYPALPAWGYHRAQLARQETVREMLDYWLGGPPEEEDPDYLQLADDEQRRLYKLGWRLIHSPNLNPQASLDLPDRVPHAVLQATMSYLELIWNREAALLKWGEELVCYNCGRRVGEQGQCGRCAEEWPPLPAWQFHRMRMALIPKVPKMFDYWLAH